MMAPSENEEPDDLSNNLDKCSDSDFDMADTKNKKNNPKKHSQYYRLKRPPKMIVNKNSHEEIKL
jgi:hypothetical protein